jgi:hypothetical protein
LPSKGLSFTSFVYSLKPAMFMLFNIGVLI